MLLFLICPIAPLKLTLSQLKPVRGLKSCFVWTWTPQHWITGSIQPKAFRNFRTETVLVQPVWIRSGWSPAPAAPVHSPASQSLVYGVHTGSARVPPSNLQAPLPHFLVFHRGRHQSWVQHMELSCVCLYTYAIKTVIWHPAVPLWFPHAPNEKGFLNSVLLIVIKAERKINSQLVDRLYMHLI